MSPRKGYVKRTTSRNSVTYHPPENMQERTRIGQIKVLESVGGGASLTKAAESAGVTVSTVNNWRKRYPEFDEVITKYMARNKLKKMDEAKARKMLGTVIFDPDREVPPKGDFATFRMRYFGRPTPPHQLPLVEALEDRTNNVIICLMPPSAGKDTIIGDWLLYEHVDDRKGLRSAWIMESENFAKRRLQRLLRYLTDKTVYETPPAGTPGAAKPESDLITDYGPFRWERGMVFPDGRKVERPEWTKLQAYFVQSIAPEADPNLWATGLGGATYGSRMKNAVISDAFTAENQKSPTSRLDQMVWTEGTLDSRLDEDGRLIVIGTELPVENNYAILEERYTRGSRIVHTSDDGMYLKYSNGTAVIKVPAIWFDDEGNEKSYWEERFPLDGQVIDKHGKVWSLADVTPEREDELMARDRMRRIRGLRERRARNSEMFEAMYNQRRPSAQVGDFSDDVLNAADDRDRTSKMVYPSEIVVVGIDPARVYGAAWVAWAVDRKNQTVTCVDSWYGTKLGIEGIKNRLILGPLTTYKPLWLAYEVNREAAVLEDWHVKEAIEQFATNVYRHETHAGNRASSEVGPASLAQYMRTGVIRWPTKTMEDQRRVDQLKQHFKAWDRTFIGHGRSRPGKSTHEPDDLAMAAWIGFWKARDLLEMSEHRVLPRMPVPRSVERMWDKFQSDWRDRQAVQKVDRQPVSVGDIVTMVLGGGDDRSE